MKKILLLLFVLFSFGVSKAQVNKSAVFDWWYASQDESLIIISVEDQAPLSVAYDTPFGSLSLPSDVNITLSDESVINVSVTWDGAGYVQDAAGIYDVFGDVSPPPGVINPFLVRAVVEVTVQEEIFTETFTAPTGFSTWVVPSGVDIINSAKAVGGGGTGGSLAQIGSASGGGGGAFAEKNNVSVTAGEVIPYYIAPQQLGPLPSGTNLDGLDGHVSYFGPSTPSGSTILSGSGAPAGGTGSDGNYYSDILNGELYGPKAAGAWPGSPSLPWVKAAGGKKGLISGAGGLGGVTADCIGDSFFEGGNGTTNAASRSGAGGGGAGSSSDGGDGQIVSGTSVLGGIGGTSLVGDPTGGAGGNGSSGAAISGSVYGGAGGGARNTSIVDRRGGAGAAGWTQVIYPGADVPPAEAGNVTQVAIWGQSNILSPGNGDPGAPYEGPQDAQIFISSSLGFDPLEWGVNNNVGGSLTGLGPELSIATSVQDLIPGELYIQKKGQSGTSMYNHWNVANNSTGRSAVSSLKASLNYLIAQGKSIERIIVVFRQGEADMGSSNPNGPVAADVKAEYKDKYNDLIIYTIDQLTSAGYDLTTINFYWIDVNIDNLFSGSADTTFQTVVVEAKSETITDFETTNPTYANKWAGGWVVSTSNTTNYQTIDGIHFNTASEINMGLDCGALIVSIIP